MRFTILGSSSSGNCSLIETNGCKILLDAGFSGKRICEMLETIGESIDNIQAVFLTHEHSDHSNGVRGLARFGHIQFFANRLTARAIQEKLCRRPQWKTFDTGSSFSFNDLTINSFSVPHDAHDPVGFVFKTGNGDLFSPHRSLAWATDLGYAPALVRERIREVDVLVLEANYDPVMLQEDTKRPWSVKQRILGRHGHLSNAATKELVDELENPNWRQVFLAHLSKDCNHVDAVTNTVTAASHHTRNYGITVVPPDTRMQAYDVA